MAREELSNHSGSAHPKKTVSWTVTMDRYLTELLVEQAHLGRKVENGFSKVAWAAVEKKLNARFRTRITKEHCKNRLRTWKKHFHTVRSLLAEDGFRWDDTSSMVIANERVWEDYTQAHPDARSFQIKPLPNFKELAIIVGKDQIDAGQFAKSSELKIINNNPALGEVNVITPHMDAEADQKIDDVDKIYDMHDTESSDAGSEGSSHQSERRSTASSGSKHSKKRKQMASINKAFVEMTRAVRSFTNGTREAAQRLEKEMRLKTIYEEIRKIPYINNQLLFKALDYLTSDENKADIFLMLDENLRHEWLLFHLSD